MRKSGWLAAWVLAIGLCGPASAKETVESVARRISKAAAASKVQRVAVLPFVSSNGYYPEDGVAVSERLLTALVERSQVRVVEREMLQSLMKEHYLANSGLVSPEGRKALGQILSVDAVVTGSFVSFGRRMTVNARLIRLESGDILFARTFEIPLDWFDPSPVGALLGGTETDSMECREAHRQLQALERELVDLKTRYWTSQLTENRNN